MGDVAGLSGEHTAVIPAIEAGLLKGLFNSNGSYAILLGATSVPEELAILPPSLIVRETLCTVGILAELVAKIQRQRFKSDRKKEGKAFTGVPLAVRSTHELRWVHDLEGWVCVGRWRLGIRRTCRRVRDRPLEVLDSHPR